MPDYAFMLLGTLLLDLQQTYKVESTSILLLTAMLINMVIQQKETRLAPKCCAFIPKELQLITISTHLVIINLIFKKKITLVLRYKEILKCPLALE